jgi:propanediol dehydratase large subunit
MRGRLGCKLGHGLTRTSGLLWVAAEDAVALVADAVEAVAVVVDEVEVAVVGEETSEAIDVAEYADWPPSCPQMS